MRQSRGEQVVHFCWLTLNLQSDFCFRGVELFLSGFLVHDFCVSIHEFSLASQLFVRQIIEVLPVVVYPVHICALLMA